MRNDEMNAKVMERKYLPILSDDEIERIIDFAIDLKHSISLPELADRLSLIGFPEMKNQIETTGKKDAKVDEETKKRRECIIHCLDICGQVAYNEEGLICPRCGSKYVAWRQFYSYLPKAPKETDVTISRRAPHRLEGASHVTNKSYYNCLSCNFDFNERG